MTRLYYNNIWLLVLCACWCLVVAVPSPATTSRQCEPIRIELCQNLGYNSTRMPNLGGNELQQEAEYILKSFNPLIEYGCSAQLKLFLCSIYAPMCTEKVPTPIGPCRSLCENVKRLCFPVLEGFGFGWPDALNCSRFPKENNHEHMCMEGPGGGSKPPETDPKEDVTMTKPHWMTTNQQQCKDGYVNLREVIGRPLMPTNNGGGCIAICDSSLLFDAADKKFAEVWVTVWAVICLVFSLASAITLCIGGGRVRIRPLMALALCYCCVATGWMIRIVAGRYSIGCRYQLSEELEDVGGGDYVVVQDSGITGNAKCTLVFFLIYYFGMAANAWWVALCIWWLSKAAFDWSTERMRNVSTLLHVFAWGVPAIQTVFVILLNKIDSDELTGVCNVGNRSLSSLLYFGLVPQAFYLFLGIKVLFIGCYKILTRPLPIPAPISALTTPLTPLTLHSAHSRRSEKNKDSDLLGALACVYVIPMASVLGCLCYEYNHRLFLQVTSDGLNNGKTRAQLSIFLLKHLMSLFIGVSSVFWLWSSKSIVAWRTTLQRVMPKRLQKQLPLTNTNMPNIHGAGQQMALQVRASSVATPVGRSQSHNRTLSTSLSTTLSTTAGSRQSNRRRDYYHRRN